MKQKSTKDKILLNRLAYFFKHFKPEQKKEMEKSVDEFLAESKADAPTSKSLYKILDYMTEKVFKPIGKIKKSVQNLKRRREKMKPSFLLLHDCGERVQKKYRAYLKPTRQTRKRKTSKSR